MSGDRPKDPARFSLSLATSDPTEVERIAKEIYTSLKIVDPSEPFSVRSTAVLIDGVMSARVFTGTGVEFETVQPFEGITITMPTSNAVDILRNRDARIRANPALGTIVRDQEAMRSKFSPNSSIYALCITDAEIQAFMNNYSSRPVPTGRWNDRTFDLKAGVGRAVMNLSAAMVEGLTDESSLAKSDLALQSLKTAVLGAVIQCLPESGGALWDSGGPSPSPRHVRRAIEYMVANAEKPISLADIAAAAEISPRALQEGFRRFRQTTPMRYLRDIRLARVHADLLDPTKPRSVSSIALNWGFFHMSDFSAQYKQVFGRAPSETLNLRR